MASFSRGTTSNCNNYAAFNEAEEKKKEEEKGINNELINQHKTFCTGKSKHSFNLHWPWKLGREQLTRPCTVQYNTMKRLVLE